MVIKFSDYWVSNDSLTQYVINNFELDWTNRKNHVWMPGSQGMYKYMSYWVLLIFQGYGKRHFRETYIK